MVVLPDPASYVDAWGRTSKVPVGARSRSLSHRAPIGRTLVPVGEPVGGHTAYTSVDRLLAGESVQFNVRLPGSVVEAMDAAAREAGTTRRDWLEAVLVRLVRTRPPVGAGELW